MSQKESPHHDCLTPLTFLMKTARPALLCGAGLGTTGHVRRGQDGWVGGDSRRGEASHPGDCHTPPSVLPQHPVRSLTVAHSSPALRLGSLSSSSRKPSLMTGPSEAPLGSHGPGLPPSQLPLHRGIAAALPRGPRAEVRHTVGPPFPPACTGFRSGLALGFRCHLPERGHALERRRAHAPPGSWRWRRPPKAWSGSL